MIKQLKDYVKNKRETKVVSNVRKEYVCTYVDFLIKKGKIKENSILVDVPCGTRDMAKAILDKVNVHKIILLDINKNMIVSAKKKVPDKSVYIIGDAGEIENLIDIKVDTIICLNGFHQYISNKKRFLKGCKKILNQGGRLIFDVSTRGLYDEYTKKFFKIQKEELGKFVKKYNIEPDLPVWPDKKLLETYKKTISDCDLHLIETQEFSSIKTVDEIRSNQTAIEGRSRPWLPGLDWTKRKEAFKIATEATLEKIGEKKIKHDRIFFISENI